MVAFSVAFSAWTSVDMSRSAPRGDVLSVSYFLFDIFLLPKPTSMLG